MKHCIIGLNERPKGKELVERTAVRGIIENKGKYLFVTTNREDCMFPGGGIEGDENHEDALILERFMKKPVILSQKSRSTLVIP